MDSLSISELLAFDLESRSDVVIRENDIYQLEDLSAKKWSYDLPTMTLYPSYMKVVINPDIITSSGEVVRKFLSDYSILNGVDMSNILVAGGSISNIIIGYDVLTDIDLFVFGLSIDQVSDRITKLINDLDVSGKSGKVIKTVFATTIVINNDDDSHITIQIIHRLYDTASQVLHGFDNGSCSVGLLLNEARVITTRLGRVALEYKINVWDPLKRGIAYETRLAKYFNRGFSIVFPDLDMDKVCSRIMKRKDVTFKGISFKAYRVIDNMIVCEDVDTPSRYSDYHSPTDEMTEISNSRSNTWKLLKGNDLVYFGEWENKEKLLSCIDDNAILNPSEDYIQSYFNDVSLFSDDTVNMKKLKFYLPDEYKQLVIEYMDSESSKEISDKAIVKCVERTIRLMQEYKAKGGYIKKWKVLDPGSQVDGTFHPDQVNIEEFYGKFLKTQ